MEINKFELEKEQNSYLNFIPTIESNLTYKDFFENYLNKNQACLIKNLAIDWDATKHWITDNGEINFQHLLSKYGESYVTIYDCDEKYYNSQKTSDCTFGEYVLYWENYRKSNYSHDLPLNYLKDWHLKNKIPGDDFYQVPLYFTSDWLNEFLVENNEDDYRFVYMGPTKSWTPFHADVFTSFSWSTNIIGEKRWVLLPPGEENKLKDAFGNLPYDITSFITEEIQYFEVIQKQGDSIFVPSGWYHQVWNLKDTISINHNWINACNLKSTWFSIQNNLIEVKHEIEDCKEMDEFPKQCQILLKASFGWDFIKFYNFMKYIALKRIDLLENGKEVIFNNGFKLGINHAMFDLKMIEYVLNLFIKDEDVIILDISCLDLLRLIENCLINQL